MVGITKDVSLLLLRDYDSLKSTERRIIKDFLIQQRGVFCERCEWQIASLIHHKDGNRQHNLAENLLLLCKDCHRGVHKRMRREVGDG